MRVALWPCLTRLWYEYRLESYAVVALNPRRQCNGVQVALNIGKRFTRNARFNSCSDYCTESIT